MSSAGTGADRAGDQLAAGLVLRRVTSKDRRSCWRRSRESRGWGQSGGKGGGGKGRASGRGEGVGKSRRGEGRGWGRRWGEVKGVGDENVAGLRELRQVEVLRRKGGRRYERGKKDF